MDYSPKGRNIEWIAGNAADIEARGREIKDLGMQMQVSAGLLRQIADGATMRGISIDKIKEVTGEVYEELQLAGERYSPTGEALKDYGISLADVQSGLQTIIDACEASWSTYATKKTAHDDLLFANTYAPAPEPGDTTAEDAVKDAEDDVTNAQDDWIDDGDDYDKKYDSWETAFELAVGLIGDATSGGIEDSWKDDFDGWVEGALQVLSWVGIALAVLCIVIGGPIFAALAAIVAIATLIGTIYLFTQGKKNGWDLALAIVGVIPFGKLSVLLKPGGVTGFLKGIVAFDEFATLGSAFRAGSGPAVGFLPSLTAGGASLWAKIGDDVTFGTVDMIAPMFGGLDMPAVNTLMQSGSGAAEVAVSHILDWNIKTVILPIVAGGMEHAANAPAANNADNWSQQLAASK